MKRKFNKSWEKLGRSPDWTLPSGDSLVMTLGWGSGDPPSRSWGQELACLRSLTFGGENFVLRKLYHCARDVLPLLGAFFNFYFYQKGFGSQLSCQGTPEISQGPLKAGGQRPLTFPFAMNDGEGSISSSGRLIQANNHPHLIIIKKKSPLSISTHVQLIIQTLQWFTSPSRLAKMHGARDIYWKKTASVWLLFSLYKF